MMNNYPASTKLCHFRTADGAVHYGFYLKDANKYVRNVNRWRDTVTGTWYNDEVVTGWW